MMRYFLILISCLFSLASIAAERAWEGLYQGTIGTTKVTVLLSHSEGIGEDSRYSYALKPYDLGLTLQQENSALIFIESRKLGASKNDLKGIDKALISGRWSLRREGSTMKGIWTDPTGKKSLPITLTLMLKPKTDKEKFSIGEDYHALWAKDLHLAPATVHKSFGSITIGMSKDSIFNLAYPRLLSHPDTERMAKMNALLETEHRAAVAAARQCQEYLPRQRPEEIKSGKAAAAENIFEVMYANPQLLSMTESGSVFCGGAHPSNYTRAMNFDLLSTERLFGREADDGGPVPLSQKHLGRIFKVLSPKERESFNSFWWGPWMEGAAKATKDDPDCADGFMNDRPMAERSADFHFTPKGLAVQRTDYAHAMSVCLFQDYNPLNISWEKLKPWLRADQKFLVDEIK